MKLRIHGNALRLRLNRAEVARFAETGLVEDSVEFGPHARLSYALEAAGDAPAASATFEDGLLRVQVSRHAAREWTATDRVGIGAEQPIDALRRLSIVVEKDFQCMHQEDEPDPEAYPNPLAAGEPPAERAKISPL